MNPIQKSGDKIRVDVDSPSPIPEIAHWIKDVEPPKQSVRIVASGFVYASSLFCDVVGDLIGLAEILVQIVAYYCSGYEIVPTKYASMSPATFGFSVPSPSIRRE